MEFMSMVRSQKSIGGVVVALGNGPYSLGVAIAEFDQDLEIWLEVVAG